MITHVYSVMYIDDFTGALDIHETYTDLGLAATELYRIYRQRLKDAEVAYVNIEGYKIVVLSVDEYEIPDDAFRKTYAVNRDVRRKAYEDHKKEY